MTEDDFGKTGSKLIENVAIGVAGVVGTIVAGSGGGVTAGAVVMTALDWLRASANANDRRVFDARFAALEDQFTRLDEEVRKVKESLAADGKQADRQDFLSQEAVYSDFARAVSEARTPEKRIALVNVAAHQFDPRLGTPEAREFWFQRVRLLTELQIAFVRLVARTQICFAANSMVQYDNAKPQPIDAEDVPGMTDADMVAFAAASADLLPTAIPGGLHLLHKGPGPNIKHNGQTFKADTFHLASAGVVLMKFISD